MDQEHVRILGSAGRAMAAELFSAGACDLIVKDHGQDYFHLLPEKIHTTLERRRREETCQEEDHACLD